MAPENPKQRRPQPILPAGKRWSDEAQPGWTRESWVWWLRRLARLSAEYNPVASKDLTERADAWASGQEETIMQKGSKAYTGSGMKKKCPKCGKMGCKGCGDGGRGKSGKKKGK